MVALLQTWRDASRVAPRAHIRLQTRAPSLSEQSWVRWRRGVLDSDPGGGRLVGKWRRRPFSSSANGHRWALSRDPQLSQMWTVARTPPLTAVASSKSPTCRVSHRWYSEILDEGGLSVPRLAVPGGVRAARYLASSSHSETAHGRRAPAVGDRGQRTLPQPCAPLPMRSQIGRSRCCRRPNLSPTQIARRCGRTSLQI